MGKKINVEKLLSDIHNHEFYYNEEKEKVEDNLAELIAKCDEDTFCYIGTAQFVNDYYANNPDSDWNICAVFQIGYPFSFPISGISSKDGKTERVPENHTGRKIRNCLRTEIWNLFVFSKKDFDKVIIGFNNCNDAKLIYKVFDDFEEIFYCVEDEDMLGKPSYSYSYGIKNNKVQRMSPYMDYYKMIQKTIEKERLIERKMEFETFADVDFEFTEVPRDSFFIEYLHTLFRYKESVVDLFGFPDNEESVDSLENELEIIDDSEQIKKDDILFNYLAVNISERKYRINLSIAETDKTKARYKQILRPKTLSPYYVLNYLKSDFVKEFVFSRLKYEQDDVIKIVEEHRGEEDELKFYQDYFFFNYTHNNDDDWQNIDIEKLPIIINHNVDTEYFQRKYEWEKQEKSSIQRHLEKKNKSTFYNQDAKDIILRDMKELKKCFTSGTYKAAIILAGSVLEAFLIDWLSEIDDRNYFEEDYMVFDKYHYKYRRADLRDYINAIEELKKPSWFDAAKKATEIRKKRNLIHAKLYIDNSDISRETCTEVINYLEYVINTRWK